MSTVSIYSGTVPNRQSQTQPQFDAAMDDTLAWLLAAPSEYNTVAGEVNANKIAAASSADAANAAKVAAQAAQTAAQNAHQGALDVLDEMDVVKQEAITDATNAGVAAAGAPRYPSGSPYALGACCSGSDGHTYRSIISNNSSNPVTNPGNWTKLTGLNAFVESVVNDFGTAALSDASEFATAAQGVKADSAAQQASFNELATSRLAVAQYSGGRVSELTETLDGGVTRVTSFVYDANGLITQQTVTIGSVSRRTTFSYSGTNVTGWSEEII